MAHRLFDQLNSANATDDEIEELYNDLKFVFDNPFDAAIHEAINVRQCSYVDQLQPKAH